MIIPPRRESDQPVQALTVEEEQRLMTEWIERVERDRQRALDVTVQE